jgi:hypothetical protein
MLCHPCKTHGLCWCLAPVATWWGQGDLGGGTARIWATPMHTLVYVRASEHNGDLLYTFPNSNSLSCINVLIEMDF